MSKDAQIAFLEDLSDVLKGHNASFDLECEMVGYTGAVANLMFDIDGSYYSCNIASNVHQMDIGCGDIDLLIKKLKKDNQ